MNEWIRKSIELANSPGYLDKLSKIYIMQVNPERPVPTSIIPAVMDAFNKEDDKGLIKLLMKYAEVFPVKDSYIGFLRLKPVAIDENPETIKRIAQRLYSLGFDRLIQESSRPMETNRQLGHTFRHWLHSLGYKVVNEYVFEQNNTDTLILEGSDKALKQFAEKKLGCTLKKGIDLIIKKNGKYIIGEAKFLTTPGGEQDRGFDDASTFIEERSGNATRMALLDGYIWLRSQKGIYAKIIRSEDNIMSAILLKDFIESF